MSTDEDVVGKDSTSAAGEEAAEAAGKDGESDDAQVVCRRAEVIAAEAADGDSGTEAGGQPESSGGKGTAAPVEGNAGVSTGGAVMSGADECIADAEGGKGVG